MGTVLVVDGSGVCRAPIVQFMLRERFARSGRLETAPVESRGLTARPGATMCEGGASRLGFSGAAIGFFGAYRALPLSVADIANADLVLTAERSQRSAVVRMLPGTQAWVFTWKEALVLASVLVDRRRTGSLAAPTDVRGMAAAMHGARGTVPLIEPPVRTGPFHWRRGAETDPLTVESGHLGRAEHRAITQESADVAGALGGLLAAIVLDTGSARTPDEPEVRTRSRWLRRSA